MGLLSWRGTVLPPQSTHVTPLTTRPVRRHRPTTQPRRWRRAVTTLLTTALTLIGAGPALANTPTSFTDPSSFGLATGTGTTTSTIAVSLDAAFGRISPLGVGSLLDSGFGLSDLNPVTGALTSGDITRITTGDYALATDLAGSSLLAINQADLARSSLAQADAARRAQTTTQGQVGPDGCPTTAPANTLRAGSANLGVAELCANSVAQAPTPEAAMAIKYQLNHLGLPYSQPKRMTDGHYDCSSLAMRSYASTGLDILVGGWAPNTAAIRASRWAEKIPTSAARPGDLIYPFPGHVATKLSDGYMVHTNRPGDVSHVKKAYTNPYYVVRVNPDKV